MEQDKGGGDGNTNDKARENRPQGIERKPVIRKGSEIRTRRSDLATEGKKENQKVGRVGRVGPDTS